MFINVKGDGAKTCAEMGFVPREDPYGDWRVVGLFNSLAIRENHDCEMLAGSIGGLFGFDAVVTLSHSSRGGVVTVVAVRPTERIIATLDEELDGFDPNAGRRDNSYQATVAPYIETYWRDAALSERIKLMREANAPASCVMQEHCPDAVRDLVEILVTS